MAYRRKSGFLWKKSGGGRATPTVMTTIPEEIYYEILLRLPVKSLLACKCVCKNWYALISTSNFVKLHQKLTIQKNNPMLMLKVNGITQLYSIDYDSLPSSSVCEIKDYDIEIDHPFKSYYCVGFSGSCNGIICTWLIDWSDDWDVFCLWNPATREYKELPKSPIEISIDNVCVHGFGYDNKTDNYKLVVGREANGSKDSTLVQVYTLASNSWKIGQTVNYHFFHFQTSGVLVNGNLHWLAPGQNNCLLLSLDIADESFKEMQLPRHILEMEMNKDLCIGVLQECLCLLVSSDVNGVKAHSEVWEMLDYGIQESWTKRYVMAHESIINDHKYFRLVRSLKNEEILLLTGNILVLYEPKHRKARELKINNFLFKNAETYFESLVSLNSGTYVGGELEKTGEESIDWQKLSDYVFYFVVLVFLLAHIYVLFFN
ncbi:F-box protein CPR1-like [Papaver somniferum]|uniref:F-box protein CPR1-like n=1 Tax=Papaver somniferum TaxID=3469 RepID=UPI000E6F5BC4|nr:F-box protein CPR1-like [Papaver somniferum]